MKLPAVRGGPGSAALVPAVALLAPLLAMLFALSCGHAGASATQTASAAQTAARTAVKPDWQIRLEEQNRRYVLDTLGDEGEDPWFSGIPRDGAFYYIALSNKTAAEHRSRARALEEARRLAREYYREAAGAEPDPQTGRGLEVIEWKIITGATDQGLRYYIACALVRFPDYRPDR